MIKPKTILTVFLVLFSLHFLSIFRLWYIYLPWIDIPMHFLGGFFVALVFLWFMDIGFFPRGNWLMEIIIVLGFTSLIGVGWEFFEFSFDFLASLNSWHIIKSQPSTADTMGDLFFDLLGGFVAYFYFATSYFERKIKSYL